MSRAAILVLGMHRSGTSALTWLLGRLGATLPDDAIAASGDNARGYWESQALVQADDQLLRVARSSWFDPRPLDLSRLSADGLRSRKARISEAIERQWGDAPLLAIKDPRQCRCVPTIVEVLGGMAIEPRAVLMLRDPAEIARSLESRDGTTPAYAHLLWLRHMIDAERATRGMERAVVDYDGLLGDWRATVSRIAPLIGRDASELDAGEIEAFLDPGLRHHRAASAMLEAPLAGIVAAVDAALRGLLDRDDAAARDRLDRAYAALDDRPWLEGEIVHDELRHRRVGPEARPVLEEGRSPAKLPLSFRGEGRGEGAVPQAAVGVDDKSGSLSFAPLTQPSPRQRGEGAFSPEVPQPAPDPSGDADLIRSSGLFDADWYRTRYPDAAASGLDPVDHYLSIGAARGYGPGPLFDTGYYARQMARRIGAAGGG